MYVRSYIGALKILYLKIYFSLVLLIVDQLPPPHMKNIIHYLVSLRKVLESSFLFLLWSLIWKPKQWAICGEILKRSSFFTNSFHFSYTHKQGQRYVSTLLHKNERHLSSEIWLYPLGLQGPWGLCAMHSCLLIWVALCFINASCRGTRMLLEFGLLLWTNFLQILTFLSLLLTESFLTPCPSLQ